MDDPKPYRIDDRAYDTLSAAKGQLTRLARRYRVFRRIVDTRNGRTYVYDTALQKVALRESP